MTSISRRDLLRYGTLLGATGVAAAGGLLTPDLTGMASAASARRAPGSLPFPKLAPGTVNEALPFDHIVVVMMENHSFDNYLGMLPVAGTRKADGFHINRHGVPTNANPGPSGTVTVFPFPSTAQGPDVGQDWNATHRQIDGGKMDGFVYGNQNTTQAMGYYPPEIIPFAYSFASTFTVGNRWFCSAPCQTYPNRRFLMAGTAYGDITTSSSTLSFTPPPNGTIFDQLDAHGISWANYFTDLPQTAIIPSVIQKYPTNISPIGNFFADCAAGTLPQVSFVDPEFGAAGEVGAPLQTVPGFQKLGSLVSATGGDEEDPQDLTYGENWAYQVVNAVLHSPAWSRTLLVYTYDEHGGYYDHVPPPRALAPDSIPPDLTATDVPGDYTLYGPRVPAVVASPYAKPNGTTNVVHDHTSVLATIEAKWNLPALTYRDANAKTLVDFLDLTSPPAFATPPTIAQPLDFLPELLATLEAAL
jgi:phospholipase C